MGRDDDRPSSGQLVLQQVGTLLVESRERLVEEQERGIVEERPAKREPLQHPLRVRARPLVAGFPETEALEQHPGSLAPLGDAVEPAVEVEVLEGGQLAVDERLVGEEADLAAFERRPRARLRSAQRGPPGA